MLAITYKLQHWMLPSPIQSNTTVSVPSQHPMLRFVRNCQHILYEVLHMLAFTYKSQHWMLPYHVQSTEYDSTLFSLQCLVYHSIQCCNLYIMASIYNMRNYICQPLCTNCSVGCCSFLSSLMSIVLLLTLQCLFHLKPVTILLLRR